MFQPLLFYCFLLSVAAIPIDNGLAGDPHVQCTSNSILVNFKTENKFEGTIYAKNYFQKDNCKGAGEERSASIELHFDSCGLTRTRSLEPRGLYVHAVIVVSFHPSLVTKVDRAIRISCFYMQAEKFISNDNEVSVFTTLGQSAAVPMPVCHYEVLKGGPRGEEVRVGLVGEEVYHKWNCETDAVDTFCMVVHDCKVDDGSGDVIQLLDEDGCSLDKFILDDLDYQGDLMAGREAHVFKYADRANLYLDCQIRISVKEPETGCLRPTCNGNRVRRDWKKSEGVGLDVAAAPMVIASLGLTEADLPYSVRRAGNHTIDFYGPEKRCLSPLGLTLALCILIMILTVTVTVFVKLFDNRKMLD